MNAHQKNYNTYVFSVHMVYRTLKQHIIFVCILMLVLLSAVYVVKTQIRTSNSLSSSSFEKDHESVRYPLNEFITTSSDMGMVKMQIELQVSDEKTADVLKQNIGQVRNLVNSIINGKSLHQINTLVTENKLQKELCSKLNTLISPYVERSFTVFKPKAKNGKYILQVNFEKLFLREVFG